MNEKKGDFMQRGLGKIVPENSIARYPSKYRHYESYEK